MFHHLDGFHPQAVIKDILAMSDFNLRLQGRTMLLRHHVLLSWGPQERDHARKSPSGTQEGRSQLTCIARTIDLQAAEKIGLSHPRYDALPAPSQGLSVDLSI